METIKLDWQDLTEENITNLYLYGDLKAHDLTSCDIHRDGTSNNSDSAQVTIELNNFYDYMSNPESPMRYDNLSQVPIVQKFFTEKTHSFKDVDPDHIGTPEMVPNLDALGEGNYTLDEVQKHFFDPNDEHGVDKHYSLQHMKLDPLSKDYDKRVYVFNSQAIHLGNEATFVVKPNGERLIENAAPTIASEDFDFVSREPKGIKDELVKAGNDLYLKPNIDPLSIGRTVNIDYPKGGEKNPKTGEYENNPPEYTQYIQDYAQAHGPYTKDSFEHDLQRHAQEYSPAKGLANVAPAMGRVIDNLWESGTTKFIDSDGHAILYGEDGFDNTYANNTNMQNLIQDDNNTHHIVKEHNTHHIVGDTINLYKVPDGTDFYPNENETARIEFNGHTIGKELIHGRGIIDYLHEDKNFYYDSRHNILSVEDKETKESINIKDFDMNNNNLGIEISDVDKPNILHHMMHKASYAITEVSAQNSYKTQHTEESIITNPKEEYKEIKPPTPEEEIANNQAMEAALERVNMRVQEMISGNAIKNELMGSPTRELGGYTPDSDEGD